MLKVRPTKMELVKLKRRLGLSRRVQKILKDRLAILTMEFIKTARRALAVRCEVSKAVDAASTAMALADGIHGPAALAPALSASETGATVKVTTKNVAGARVPSLALRLPPFPPPAYDPHGTSAFVDTAAEAGRDALRAMIALAELQRSLEITGAEIKRTKRISNALEYLVIPSLETTIRVLSMKFEERDREEKSRLKRVKVLISRAAEARDARV
ncbi:MAG: V-type ATP synthase subunit D [Opitutales bacterium]|nr:V-type ATP synthase subunit D [Opitutales bacterium]